MAKITYISHDGNDKEVDVDSGSTLMIAAIDNGIDGIVAECGGACSCATCHIYIDDAWIDKVPPASSTETDMLDCVLEPKANSRLSCQITVDDSLDGLIVRLPESQF